MAEDGRRKRGRRKNTGRSTLKEDLEEMGVSWHGARSIASDCERWRLLVARCSESLSMVQKDVKRLTRVKSGVIETSIGEQQRNKIINEM